MRWINIVLLALLIGVLIVVLIITTDQPLPPERIKYVIGVSQNNLENEWNLRFNEEVLGTLEEDGEISVVFCDAGDDAGRQNADIFDMVAEKVDVIIVHAADYDAQALFFRDVISRGTPLILIEDRAGEKEAFISNIYVDYDNVGYLAGQYAAKKLRGNGIVMEIQGDPFSDHSRAITAGFDRALAESPGITKKYVAVGYWLRSRTTQVLSSSLVFEKSSGIKMVFAHNCEMAIGADMAAKENGFSVFTLGVGEMAGAALTSGAGAGIKLPTGGREAIQCALDYLQNGVCAPLTELRPVIDEYPG